MQSIVSGIGQLFGQLHLRAHLPDLWSVFSNVCKAIRQKERRLEENGSNKEALSATLSQFRPQSQTSSCLRPSRMFTRTHRTVLSAHM